MTSPPTAAQACGSPFQMCHEVTTGRSSKCGLHITWDGRGPAGSVNGLDGAIFLFYSSCAAVPMRRLAASTHSMDDALIVLDEMGTWQSGGWQLLLIPWMMPSMCSMKWAHGIDSLRHPTKQGLAGGQLVQRKMGLGDMIDGIGSEYSLLLVQVHHGSLLKSFH